MTDALAQPGLWSEPELQTGELIRLPAISLWQPWASAALEPDLKGHETRHWPLPVRLIRKRGLIHAAMRQAPWDLDPRVEAAMCERFGSDWRATRPRGAYIGSAVFTYSRRVEDAKPRHANDNLFGDWSAGRFVWALDDVVRFETPIPAKGHQGWFYGDVPRALAA